MRNLVLGSDGFIGKPLCRYLKSLGEEVVEMDIKSGNDATMGRLPFEGVDRIYFLAWDVGGAKYLFDPTTQTRQLERNTALLYHVMIQLTCVDIPFVFTSSQLAAFDNCPYGVLKRLGELWTSQSKHGVSLRLWNVYGEMEEPGPRSHVVSDFVRQVASGNIQMLSRGGHPRQFVHMDDVCRALHHAFSVDGTGPYDVSSFKWTKISDLAKMISSLTDCDWMYGAEVEQIRDNSTPTIPLPGWKAEVRLEDGLKRMIECGT